MPRLTIRRVYQSWTAHRRNAVTQQVRKAVRSPGTPDGRQMWTEKPYRMGASVAACGSLTFSAGIALLRISKTSHPPSSLIICRRRLAARRSKDAVT